MQFSDGAAVVRERSGGLCEVCRGANGRGTQTHHRQPRGMGGAHGVGRAVNRPSALVRLCTHCHGWVESHRTAAEALGLLVRRPAEPGAQPVWLDTVYGRGWWLLDDEGCYGWVHDLADPDGPLPYPRPLPTLL